MNKAVRILIYVLWGLFSLLILIYLTFPTDVLKDVVKVQLESRLGGEYRVDIDDVSLAGLTGVTLHGLRILPLAALESTGAGGQSEQSADPASGDSSGAPSVNLPTIIDEASGTVGLGSVLGGDPAFDFELVMGNGVLYGSWDRDPEDGTRHLLQISAERVPLERLGVLSTVLKGVVMGNLTGNITLGYDASRVLDGGQIAMVIDGFGRGPGPLKIPGAPAEPYLETPTRFGQVRVDATLDGSELNIGTFESIGGPDVEFQVLGRVSLRSPLSESSLFLTIHVGFSEEWKNENGFEGVIRNIPLLRQACTADNQCSVALRGVARQVNPQPL